MVWIAEIGTPAAIRPIMGTTDVGIGGEGGGARSLAEGRVRTLPRLPSMTFGLKVPFLATVGL